MTSSDNNSRPLVSVIIPVYNLGRYVEECVTSVLKSTYSPLEVILVDDGSTDDSLAIITRIAATNHSVTATSQPNSGVSRARNHAIHLAKGELILPVDADDKIASSFIEHAVQQFIDRPDVMVVTAHGEFFGDRTGVWKLPPFDLHLLARRNIISACAMYRKSDWERAGGYCEHINGREDWDYWIALLKDGGIVVTLDEVGFYYRIRPGSKRIADRKHKASVVATLNERHAEFFARELGGPLHVHRSWSRPLNRLSGWKKRILRQH